jgi:hypothetical protein
MRDHEELAEELVSILQRGDVEPFLGATGSLDQLLSILQLAVLDHELFSCRDCRWLGIGATS